MGTAVNSLVTTIRAYIPEVTAIEFSDLRIIAELNAVRRRWEAKLGMLPGPGWFTIDQTFILPANATTYDLSGLLSAATGEVAGLKTVWYRPDAGKAVRIGSAAPGQEEEYRLGVGQSPGGQTAPLARWLSRPAGVPTLNIHPEASVARNFRAYVRYEGPTVAAGDSVQTDPRHDDVLILGTVLRVLPQVGEDDPSMRTQLEKLEQEYIEAERNAAGEHESETTKVVISDEIFSD